MSKDLVYRPANIEFDVANSSILPDSLGIYETDADLYKFVHENTTAFSVPVTVNRLMDNFEKTEIRKEYQELLEMKLPLVEKDLKKANIELEEAKRKQKDAAEMLNATMSEVKSLAFIVKEGVKEMKLDDLFTFRLPFKGKYYYYTWIDKNLKLCKVSDIPDFEKSDLFNAMGRNEEFFETNFGKENE